MAGDLSKALKCRSNGFDVIPNVFGIIPKYFGKWYRNAQINNLSLIHGELLVRTLTDEHNK